MYRRRKWTEIVSRFLRLHARPTPVLQRARRAINSVPTRSPTESRICIGRAAARANFPDRRLVFRAPARHVPDLDPGHRGNRRSVPLAGQAKVTIAPTPSPFPDLPAALADHHSVPIADRTTGRTSGLRAAHPAADRHFVRATGHIPNPTPA